ncbi:hypothetical protein DL771_001090 [Monosporascus sp. 5C6A]|nr:hypothetical protein DL771_001090 [Monosporascus sp. 5C6A]
MVLWSGSPAGSHLDPQLQTGDPAVQHVQAQPPEDDLYQGPELLERFSNEYVYPCTICPECQHTFAPGTAPAGPMQPRGAQVAGPDMCGLHSPRMRALHLAACASDPPRTRRRWVGDGQQIKILQQAMLNNSSAAFAFMGNPLAGVAGPSSSVYRYDLPGAAYGLRNQLEVGRPVRGAGHGGHGRGRRCCMARDLDAGGQVEGDRVRRCLPIAAHTISKQMQMIEGI